MDYTSLGGSNSTSAAHGEQSGLVGMATGALDHVKPYLPDFGDVYVQPLDPGSQLSLSDRASLVMQSMRPWGEFLDLSAFNLPTIDEANKRLAHNVRTYFYNYFLLTCLHLVIFSFGHFSTVLVVTLYSALMWFMFSHHPDNIDVAGKFTLDENGKVAVAIGLGILAVLFGHVFTFIISLAIFLLIVVGVHGLLRDNTMDAMEPVM